MLTITVPRVFMCSVYNSAGPPESAALVKSEHKKMYEHRRSNTSAVSGSYSLATVTYP